MGLSSFFILLPLYIYPGTSNWQPLYSVLSAYPNQTFNIVINPNNGPGSNPPDSNYITGVSTLNGYANANLYGYIHTAWSTRTQASVESDLNLFSGWGTYTKKDIHMDGIFFDQVPTATDASTLAYMQNLTTYARNAANMGNAVFFNTGATTPAAYYAMADYINSYEAPNAYLNNALAALSFVSATLAGQSSSIIYGYESGTTQLVSDVTSLVKSGLAGVYVTDYYDFQAFPNGWSTFVGDVYSAYSSLSVAKATATKTSTSSTPSTTPSTTTSSTTSTSSSSSIKATSTPTSTSSSSSSSSLSSSPSSASSTRVTTTTSTSRWWAQAKRTAVPLVA